MIKLMIGGKQSGKTTSGALDVVLELVGEHPLQKQGLRPKPPIEARCTTVSFDAVDKQLMPEYLHWIPKDMVKKVDYRAHIIYLTNGSYVDFMTYDQEVEKHGQVRRDIIHNDEEPREDIFNEELVRIAKKHGRIILTMTPYHGMSWTYDKIFLKAESSDPADDDYFTRKCSVHDNPYITAENKKRILDKITDSDQRRIAEYGDWVEFAGLIWPGFSHKMHCVPRFELDYETERDGKKTIIKPTRYMAIDPMDRVIMCLWIAVYPNERAVAYDELAIENATVDEIAREIVKHDGGPIKRRWIDWNAWSTGPGGGTTFASELFKASKRLSKGNKDKEIRCAPAQKGPGSVRKGNLIVAEYLKTKDVNGHPKFIMFDDLNITKYQFSHYVYGGSRRYEEGHNPSPTPKKKDDHQPDNARYILSTRPKYIPPGGTIIRSPISGKTMQVKSPVTGWVRNIPRRN